MENGKNIFIKKIYNRMRIGNDSGFTLLELLIAMLILSVALIPMLNSFAVNAKVNQKAKVKLRATMIAQDIMEGIKGYSTKDIYKQFTGASEFRLIDNEAIVNPADKKVISVNTTVSASSAEGLTASYIMKGLVYQGQRYDAKLDIDGTNFTASGNRLNLSGNVIQPNSEGLADLSVMDSHYDGIFMSDNYNTRQEFLDKLIDVNGWLGTEVNRTFEIELKDAGVTAIGNPKQVVTVNVTYNTVSAGMIGLPYSRNYTAYNNIDIADDGCSIRSLYFFYYPAYDGIYNIGGAARNIKYNDKIVFKNEDKIPTTIYIMKQKTTDPLILPELYMKEETYKLDVTVKEDSFTSYDNRVTTICTNLMKSLYNGADLPTGNITFRFGSSLVNASMLQADRAVSTRTVNRMFDAVVTIYSEGAADAGFPDSMLLTTLDSTKINQ
ncbi:MAG: prepilin-type N-terminal cleavage/methylation domain-containing protein [Lachnospiraceae bacterium]|nr:prepilin-type N-terminal cleavage/methylation domain-containing protein [Lachnospiraceae bacterium]